MNGGPFGSGEEIESLADQLNEKIVDTVPRHFVVQGPPITPELQAVFGAFGKVKGIGVQTLNIDVSYEDGCVVTFVPVFYPAKQEKP